MHCTVSEEDGEDEEDKEDEGKGARRFLKPLGCVCPTPAFNPGVLPRPPPPAPCPHACVFCVCVLCRCRPRTARGSGACRGARPHQPHPNRHAGYVAPPAPSRPLPSRLCVLCVCIVQMPPPHRPWLWRLPAGPDHTEARASRGREPRDDDCVCVLRVLLRVLPCSPGPGPAPPRPAPQNEPPNMAIFYGNHFWQGLCQSHMAIVWQTYGKRMAIIWQSYGNQYVNRTSHMAVSYGSLIWQSLWQSYGNHMANVWQTYGNRMSIDMSILIFYG